MDFNIGAPTRNATDISSVELAEILQNIDLTASASNIGLLIDSIQSLVATFAQEISNTNASMLACMITAVETLTSHLADINYSSIALTFATRIDELVSEARGLEGIAIGLGLQEEFEVIQSPNATNISMKQSWTKADIIGTATLLVAVLSLLSGMYTEIIRKAETAEQNANNTEIIAIELERNKIEAEQVKALNIIAGYLAYLEQLPQAEQECRVEEVLGVLEESVETDNTLE